MSENGYSYSISRTVAASAAEVWDAWTTPEQYAQWAYAKPGSVEQDVRPGGAWKATIVTPDGFEAPLTGRYLEVVEHQRLVVGMDVPGQDDLATMVLDIAPADGKTEVTLSQTCATSDERDECEAGSSLLLAGLETFLAA